MSLLGPAGGGELAAAALRPHADNAPAPVRLDAPAAARVRGDGPGHPVCVINGRFLGQGVTGVQRYAHEIIRALDPLLQARGREADVALPHAAAATVPFPMLRLRPISRLSGHLWEQAVLPFASRAPLLSLCNTGPLLRRRQVVCLHDANVVTWPESYRRSFRLFYRALQPLLARRAAVIATVSEASAADLSRHLGLERRRIVVLPNGHEHALRWRSDPIMLGRVPAARPFVLLLGSRARHKNMTLLLRLAPVLDERGIDVVVAGGPRAIFAGDGGEPRRSGNIHWLGHVSDDALAALMARALCLAFPSWTEGFGLPIVEAMARGCPVVSSDRASMPEVCGMAALLAAPDDPAAWLAAITKLHRTPELRADLAGRGKIQARRFSWGASARGYLDLLEQIA